MNEHKINDIVVMRRFLNPQMASDVNETAVGIILDIQDNAEQEWANLVTKVYVVESLSGQVVATDQVLSIDEFKELFHRMMNSFTVGMIKAEELCDLATCKYLTNNINTYSENIEEEVNV